jgi:PAS domain S-box-containing protein
MGMLVTSKGFARVYSMLFDHAVEGLVVVDAAGMIVMQNPRLSQMFGHEPGELHGRSIEELVPAGVRGKHHVYRAQYHKDPDHRPLGKGREVQGQRKDGSTFPLELSLSHFQVDGDRYVVALVIDTTDRKLAQDEIEGCKEELEKRVEQRTAELRAVESELRRALTVEKEVNFLKSRFVGMASHEFRTPLTTIMGSVDLIARYNESGDQEKIGKHIHRIRNKVKELVAIIEEFLSMEKLEHGGVAIVTEEFDVVDACAELFEDMRPLLKSGQEIRYEHVGTERTIVQDRNMIAHVLTNLLTNAIKYSPNDLPINVITRIENEAVHFIVQDQGIGIPKDEQMQLFQRFFRASNARSEQGTGLGLTIVLRYVELLGGRIFFTSDEGKGTTFTTELPQQHPATKGTAPGQEKLAQR